MTVFSQERLGTLNAAYARSIDNDQVEQWPGYFTDGCLYVVSTADNHAAGMQAGVIYADSRGMLEDRVSALREANVYEQHRYRHIVGLPLVLEQDGAQARVETPFLVARTMRDGATQLFVAGRYLDRVVEQAGELRFAERIVVCDSQDFDTLLVIPI